MYRRRAVRALLAFVLLCPALGFAQRRPTVATEPVPRLFSIRGNVRYMQDERPAEMVKIDLRRFSGETVGTTFTRSNGEFEFGGLTTGTFYIVIEEQGYEPVRDAIEILNSSRFGILVYLKKSAQVTPGESGTAVSVRELSLSPKARDALRKGIERLYERRDSQGSLTHFQRVLQQAPDYYEAHFHLGIAYADLQRHAEAEQEFQRSIESSGQKYAEPHFALGSLFSNQKRFAEAEALIRRGLEISSDAWQGHYELGRALFGMNRVDEAEKCTNEVLQRHRNYAPVHLLRANIHIRKKNHPAVLIDLDEYLRLEPNGFFSVQARQTRERIQRQLESAKNVPPGP